MFYSIDGEMKKVIGIIVAMGIAGIVLLALYSRERAPKDFLDMDDDEILKTVAY